MAKVVAIPGSGYYCIYLSIEHGGRTTPRLIPASGAEIEDAKEAFEVVRVDPVAVATCFPEKISLDEYEFLIAAPHPSPCPVELRGEGLPAKVGDIELPTAAGSAYRALAHLVRIYPSGVKREVLNDIAGVKDISGALGALVRRDSRWAEVLRFPRRQGEIRGPSGVYSISPLRREPIGVISA